MLVRLLHNMCFLKCEDLQTFSQIFSNKRIKSNLKNVWGKWKSYLLSINKLWAFVSQISSLGTHSFLVGGWISRWILVKFGKIWKLVSKFFQLHDSHRYRVRYYGPDSVENLEVKWIKFMFTLISGGQMI